MQDYVMPEDLTNRVWSLSQKVKAADEMAHVAEKMVMAIQEPAGAMRNAAMQSAYTELQSVLEAYKQMKIDAQTERVGRIG